MSSKIMIVDDERMIIQYVSELLSSWGYVYNFVIKPKLVFKKLALEPVDLILLDVNMPEIDGVTLLKQLKETPEYAHIPVIMMTGDAKEETLADCFENGASDFVTKPIKDLVLKVRIKTQVENKLLYNSLEKKVQERTQEVVRQKQEIEEKNEELKQNMEELKAAQEAMEEKNEELQQNMEELKAAQETMEEKQKELEIRNIKIETSEYLLKQSKSRIETSLNKLESQNRFITTSIQYAKNIQQAILPTPQDIEQAFADYFVFYKPKDIVSGDFYWLSQIKDTVFVAVVDCTGHGVPGAFMSLVGYSLLNEIVNQQHVFEPNKILDKLHKGVRVALNQEKTNNADGMDIGLCRLRKQDSKTELTYSGAKQSLYYIKGYEESKNGKEKELQNIKGDRQSIGGRFEYERIRNNFQNHAVILEKGDLFYLSSDGMRDSPNPKRKSLGENRINQLIKVNAHLPLQAQQKQLIYALAEYQQDADQRDDITVAGFKLT